MSDALDAPTVCRTGQPTLGVPLLSLAYRQEGEAAILPYVAPIVLVQQRVLALENRATRFEAEMRFARRPWWVRWSVCLRARVIRVWYHVVPPRGL